MILLQICSKICATPPNLPTKAKRRSYVCYCILINNNINIPKNMITILRFFPLIFVALTFQVACYNAPSKETDDFWVLFADTLTQETGYLNLKGDTVMSGKKYAMYFTDTFRNFAIVAMPNGQLTAIDRQEKKLYQVFAFDNVPDPEADGLFRIQEKEKIGFANAKTGEIAIKPQFNAANPFEQGKALVSNDCQMVQEGEYHLCKNGTWFYIDKNGEKLDIPAPKN